MSDENSPTFTPNFRSQKNSEKNLNKYLDQNNSNSMLLNTVAFVILRHMAKLSGETSLESVLATERSGGGPHIEGVLRDTLHRLGNNRNEGVLYGGEIPVDMREQWQRVGIDADSENELFQYFSNNKIEHIFNNEYSNKMQEQGLTTADPNATPRPKT